MLRSLCATLGYRIAATDGKIGRVYDFLFDDESWLVHYVEAEIDAFTQTTRVLLFPFAAGRPNWETKQLPVLLTCDQIRNSPSMAFDVPVSMQYRFGFKRPGSHLRSLRELLGYSVCTPEGKIGVVQDFIVEDTLWDVHKTVIMLTQPRVRSVLIAPQSIRSISCSGRAVWIRSSLDSIGHNPEFDPSEPINQESAEKRYDYYGRPVSEPQDPRSENGALT